MKRFLISVSMLLAMLLTACTGGVAKSPEGGPKWGALDVTFQKIQAQQNSWTADVQVKNNTKQTQLVQYTGPAKYSIHVLKDGKEIYKEGFGPISQPLLLNILPDAVQSHIVAWRYVDQAGQRVPPGKYQVKAELHAETGAVKGSKMVGPVDVEVK